MIEFNSIIYFFYKFKNQLFFKNIYYPDCVYGFRPHRSYIEYLAPLREASKDLPPVPEDTLSDAYAALNEIAEVMDYDTARLIMDSLKEYSLPDKDAKICEKILECLSQMDWDGIREALKGVN